jgi:hypothetical protein
MRPQQNLFTPEQFARRPGIAQIETDLMRWLRSRPVDDRVSFIAALWPLNCNFALVLVRRTQLPTGAVVSLLRSWLQQGQHSAADRLIRCLVPVLGESRFWSTVESESLDPQMAHFLDYHSGGHLKRLQIKSSPTSNKSRGADA